MKYNFTILAFVLLSLMACKKDNHQSVDIYLLKSFSATAMAQSPYSIQISNAVLENQPLVSNQEIEYFTASTTTFKLKKDISAAIKDFSADKAFAVTVDGTPVYYGLFHPAYLNSISFNIATIDPFFYSNNDLKIVFESLDNTASLQCDHRLNERLLNALKASNRLR